MLGLGRWVVFGGRYVLGLGKYVLAWAGSFGVVQ